MGLQYTLLVTCFDFPDHQSLTSLHLVIVFLEAWTLGGRHAERILTPEGSGVKWSGFDSALSLLWNPANMASLTAPSLSFPTLK